jgi:hypothetical protein
MMYSPRTSREECFLTAGCDFMYASQKTLFRIIQDLPKKYDKMLIFIDVTVKLSL